MDEKIVEISQKAIYIGGKPLFLLSAEMHYYRIDPSKWPEEILSIKEKICGQKMFIKYNILGKIIALTFIPQQSFSQPRISVSISFSKLLLSYFGAEIILE